MSGLVKAIGKAFKSVVKVIKKIAVPVLIVGAIVLTGGAAIGALPALGSVLGSIGISGTMASVIGGAVSGIAVGAGTGAIGSLISGGSIWKGIKSGALMGGLTGGVMGGLGMVSPNGILSDMGVGSKIAHLEGLKATGTASAAQLDQLAQLKGAADVAKGAPAANLSTNPITTVDPGASNAVGEFTKAPGTARMAGVENVVNGLPADSVAVQSADAAATTPLGVGADGNVIVQRGPTPQAVAGGGGGGGGGGSGGLGLAGNPGPWMMGGNVISGLGQAMVGASVAKADKDEQRRIAASYNVDPSAHLQLTPGANASLPSPSERFGSSTAYYYDPKTGRVLPKGA